MEYGEIDLVNNKCATSSDQKLGGEGSSDDAGGLSARVLQVQTCQQL
jgi:hypothetical protein